MMNAGHSLNTSRIKSLLHATKTVKSNQVTSAETEECWNTPISYVQLPNSRIQNLERLSHSLAALTDLISPLPQVAAPGSRLLATS